MSKRILAAAAILLSLSGCGIFKGKGGPKTAVLGERIPVLAAESDAAVDPALAATAITLPPPEANPAWAQAGGTATKVVGHLALGGTLTRAWTASIAKASATERLAAGPVVADGRLYVADAQGSVNAFSTRDGARLWRSAIGKSDAKSDRKFRFGGGVATDAGRVYATNGLGDVAAMDAATGKPVWQVRVPALVRGAPAIGGGNLYVLTQDNIIMALKPDTGEILWNASATIEAAGVFGTAAPAIAQGTVVAGFSSGELSALRYENGRVVWQDQLSRTSISTSVSAISDIDASPVIDQGKVYAIGQGGRMVALDLLSGQRQWELNVGGISTPWVAGDWLFVVTDEAKVLCISKLTGHVRWISQLERFIDKKSRNKAIGWFGPVLAGGRLLLVSSRGDLASVDPADGKLIGTVEAGKSFSLPPIVADNMLFLIDEKGRITAWR